MKAAFGVRPHFFALVNNLHLTGLTYPDGSKVTYVYDQLNRLTQVLDDAVPPNVFLAEISAQGHLCPDLFPPAADKSTRGG